MGTRPDLDILGRLHPELNISSEQLCPIRAPQPPGRAYHHGGMPPFARKGPASGWATISRRLSGCPHLVFVGTNDEVHLQQVLRHFDLGKDFDELLTSYYQSPGDLDLFATIVNDLYEMFISQGRLESRPVECETAAQGFYYLLAYFAGPPPEQDTRH